MREGECPGVVANKMGQLVRSRQGAAGLMAACSQVLKGVGLGLSKGWEPDIGKLEPACLHVTCAKTQRATCQWPTRCGQASGSLCLGSRGKLGSGFLLIRVWIWRERK